MLNWLSHPATVHVPIALGVLLPFAHGAIWYAVKKGLLPSRAWVLMAFASTIQLGACVLAFLTGLKSKPLSSAAPELLSRHQDLAVAFCVVAALSLVLSIAAATEKMSKLRVSPAAVLFVLLLLQMALTAWVGRLGGMMVFG
jgi:hypothetical protein